MRVLRERGVRACAIGMTVAAIGAGCQSDPKPAPESEASTAEGREQLDVQVEGAESTREGSTITLDYPVAPATKNDLIPDWAINPGLGGVLGAVGVARANTFGTKEQLDEARLNARLELANMLEARFQDVGRTQLEEQLEAAGSSGVRDNSRLNYLGVDRSIADVVLAGTRQRALWFDPESGEVYVWVVLDGAVLSLVDHYLVNEVSVFVANTAIESEYTPERRRPSPPTVIIQEGPPAPPPPLQPLEELEAKLKEIETIPLKEGDGG